MVTGLACERALLQVQRQILISGFPLSPLFGTMWPMTRIDCHAHAFPTVTEIANKTASAIDEWVPGAWKDPVQSLGGQVSSLLGSL